MKDYKFKEEFEKKLGSDKESFIENLKEQIRYTIPYCSRFNTNSDFENFICDAFLWHKTKEGYEFWKDIAKR